VKQPEDIYDPENHHNYHHCIEYPLDRPLHGNETVDKPQQDSDYYQGENDGDQWHRIFSDRISSTKQYLRVASHSRFRDALSLCSLQLPIARQVCDRFRKLQRIPTPQQAK
jgi:hypothetical protein